MNNINITLNNKKKITVPYNTKIMQIVLDNADVCEDKIIGARINNEIVDFLYEIKKDTNIDLFDINDVNGYKITQSGLKFVLEVALKKLFGNNVEARYDHSIGNGIYVRIENIDFDENKLGLLKNQMDKIIENDEIIYKLNVIAKEAIDYYDKLNAFEKSSNIHNILNNVVFVYRLENYINYFYTEMPYSTSYLSDFELVYIDKNVLSLVLPNNYTFNLLEYKQYEKITRSFIEERQFLANINLKYICDMNKEISLGRSMKLIRIAETRFDNQIRKISEKIINNKIKYVLIAGPSSSGKTTSANKICLSLKSEGYNPLLISTDDYFVNKDDSPKNPDGTFNFEAIECIDIKQLNQDLKDLKDGKKVVLPTYNFKKGKREYINDSIELGDNDIIIIEGIHCLNDKLTSELDNEKKLKVYLSPFMAIKIDRHNYVSTTDLRLIRRIIRDNNNRGCDVSETLRLWQGVRRGEEEYIFPYIDQADIILNTALFYELGVLKVFAVPLLYSVNNDSKYLEEARRLVRFFENVYPISSELVDEASILREFIGGSIFKKESDK